MELLLEYRTISQQESKENQVNICPSILKSLRTVFLNLFASSPGWRDKFLSYSTEPQKNFFSTVEIRNSNIDILFKKNFVNIKF